MATLEQEAFAGAEGHAGPIMVGVAGPETQRRWTVAVRLALALPHLIILGPLGAGAAVVSVIGWAGALATGRLPGFAAAYLADCTRWTCRVAAYLLLLTDAYPPFSPGEDPGYPAGADLSPGRLPRLTTAFRLLLGVPAMLAAAVAIAGTVTVVAFAAWVITLAAGRLPAPLHHGFTAVLRYLVRCHGYVYLLTGAYPNDIFQGISRAAQRIVMLILVLGMITVATGGAFGGIWARAAIARERTIIRFDDEVNAHNAAVAGHEATLSKAERALAQTDTAATALANAQATLNSTLNATNTRINSCSTAQCFDALNVSIEQAAAGFGRAMKATPVPAGATALARRVATETAAYKKSWIYMSHATSLADVEHRSQRSEKTETQFYAADNALSAWLKNRAHAIQRKETALDRQAGTLNQSGDALRRRAGTLGVQAGIRTARLSREPVTSAA